ncbi:MAG: LPS export ABC transporter ATP-binding protein [Candidatus Adiutricales bacterium]
MAVPSLKASSSENVKPALAGRLRVEDLVKTYGRKRVVDQVSLSVDCGEIVGLLGPNGAGKTTTFYMIVGLIRADKGCIFLNEINLTDIPMYKRARLGISYLPQEPSVFRKLTVEDNILAILEIMDLSKSERKRRLEKLLEDLGIAHLAKTKSNSLSGGERRRVEISRALVTSPTFLLLDEPFSGIDPLAVLDIQNIILQLKENGIGILISDHNVRETLGVCERAYILNQGVILEEGSPVQIAESEIARKIYLGDNFKL